MRGAVRSRISCMARRGSSQQPMVRLYNNMEESGKTQIFEKNCVFQKSYSNFAHQKHSSRLEKYGIVAKKTDSLCTFSQFF